MHSINVTTQSLPVVGSAGSSTLGPDYESGAGRNSASLGSPQQAAKAALGITTVNSAAFSPSSGQSSLVSPVSFDFEAVNFRLLKYELQAVAQALLPEHRVRTCLLCRRPDVDIIGVLYSPQRRCARYDGLMVCGSPWVCAVCSSKISEVRRDELARGLKWHRDSGGVVYLASLTVSHGRSDELHAFLRSLLVSYQWMTKQRSFARLRASVGLVGTIRATEVTWGVLNGWHPHFHVLFLVADGVARLQFEEALRDCWLPAAARHGLAADREHGVNVRHTTDAVDRYVAKFGRPWSVEDELVKANSKRGRRSNMTPFDLLRRVAETGESWPAPLFREYAAAFYRQQQLRWSHGLKKSAGIGDRTDEQIVQHDEQEALWIELLQLSSRDWFAVRRLGMRGHLLEVARTGDAAAVRSFVHGLVEQLGS